MEIYQEERSCLARLKETPTEVQLTSDQPTFDGILQQIADTNQTPHPWDSVAELLHVKIDHVVGQTEFPVSDKDVEKAQKEIEKLLAGIHAAIRTFTGFPFTLQRLCELLVVLPPTQKTKLKYVKAIEKMLSVTGDEDILVDWQLLRKKPPTTTTTTTTTNEANHHYHHTEKLSQGTTTATTTTTTAKDQNHHVHPHPHPPVDKELLLEGMIPEKRKSETAGAPLAEDHSTKKQKIGVVASQPLAGDEVAPNPHENAHPVPVTLSAEGADHKQNTGNGITEKKLD